VAEGFFFVNSWEMKPFLLLLNPSEEPKGFLVGDSAKLDADCCCFLKILRKKKDEQNELLKALH